jgi:hypothetical protein
LETYIRCKAVASIVLTGLGLQVKVVVLVEVVAAPTQATKITLPKIIEAVAPNSTIDEQPTMIIIFVDDLGYVEIGTFDSQATTANIDRVAAAGDPFS